MKGGLEITGDEWGSYGDLTRNQFVTLSKFVEQYEWSTSSNVLFIFKIIQDSKEDGRRGKLKQSVMISVTSQFARELAG